jgi:mRNA interferase MazF
MGMVVKRFDVWLINLDPTVGSEIKKTRPGVIVSPDEMNNNINTIIIAPMTTKCNSYPTRINFNFQSKNGQIVLDHIRTIDKTRLVKYLGKISESEAFETIKILNEIFDY